MIIQHEYSRANVVYMDDSTKLAALRFMLSMPLGQWFGISALPNYVWEYIYEVGTLIDLPWIRFRDDDTGQRVQRIQHTEKPVELAQMLWGSPLFRHVPIKEVIQFVYFEQVSVTGFERYLLKYLKQCRKS
jgi:hypothetical protein